MRSFYILFILILIFVCSCTKTGNSTGNSGNSNGNGGNSNPNGSNKISIAHISPDVFYTDDIITITGTGFNPDKSKDTIIYGIYTDSSDDDTTQVFRPGTLNADKLFTIVSATTTQLVIHASQPDSLLYKIFRTNMYVAVAKGFLQVLSNGASGVSAQINIRNNPQLSSSLDLNSYYPMYPGDSVELYLDGIFEDNICNVSVYLSCSKGAGCDFVNQYLNKNYAYIPTPCDCNDFGVRIYGCGQGGNSISVGSLISYDSSNHSAVIHGYVPIDFFGTTYHSGTNGPVINVKAKAVNIDNKSSKIVTFPINTIPRHL